MYCYYGMSRLLLSGTGANIIVGEFAVTKRHMHDAIVDKALKALIGQALLLGASGVAMDYRRPFHLRLIDLLCSCVTLCRAMEFVNLVELFFRTA